MILTQRTAQYGLTMNNMEKVVMPVLHLDAGHILETQLVRSLGLDKYAHSKGSSQVWIARPAAFAEHSLINVAPLLSPSSNP